MSSYGQGQVRTAPERVKVYVPLSRLRLTGTGMIEKENKNSYERIYDVVRRIPKGRVATYGQVAALAGNCRWSRVVGYALHVNPDPDGIPCYRVVNRLGEVSAAFAFGGENQQISLLEADGIPCPGGRVDLALYQWKPGAWDHSAWETEKNL